MFSTNAKLTNKQSYDINLKLKEYDLSNEIFKVRIVSTVNTPYLVFFIDLFLNPTDLILEKLYGKDALTLTIRFTGTDGIPRDNITFELSQLSSNFGIAPNKILINKDQPDRSHIKLICIPRNEFKLATIPINAIYHNKKIKDILEDIVNVKAQGQLELDENGLNNNLIDQIIIPPLTVMGSIRFINDNFGLYNNPFQVSYEDKNKVSIINLTNKINNKETLQIYHLSLNKDQNKIIEDKCIDDKNFITYNAVRSEFNSNAKIPIIGNNIVHILKPKDKFFHKVENTFEDVMNKYGMIFKNKEIQFDHNMENRKKYYINQTGFGTDETLINNKLCNMGSNMASLIVTLERHLLINNLLKAGECIRFNTSTVEYSDLAGRYILRGSDISLFKNSLLQWGVSAKLYLMRTNKYN